MKTFLLAAASLLFAACPLQAQQPEDVSRTARVSYADLDLTHSQGRETLDQRLRDAARRLCSETVEPGPLDWIAQARCERETVAEARRSAALAAARAERRMRLARSASAR